VKNTKFDLLQPLLDVSKDLDQEPEKKKLGGFKNIAKLTIDF
jgi:hypothetical protein